jgi:hypothetical protein
VSKAFAQQNTVSPTAGTSTPTSGVNCTNNTQSCQGTNVSLIGAAQPSSGGHALGLGLALIVAVAAAYGILLVTKMRKGRS